jgi:Protein of unknown function (DUF2505)
VHVDRKFHYDATPSEVVEMMADPEFQKRKCAASGALSNEVMVQPGTDPVVTVVRRMPVDRIPEMMRALVRRGITIRETVRWSSAAADGSRDGTVALEILGQPVTMRGTIRLAPSSDGTDGRIQAEVKAAIPWLGGKVEKAVEPAILAGIKTEIETGQAYLAEHS